MREVFEEFSPPLSGTGVPSVSFWFGANARNALCVSERVQAGESRNLRGRHWEAPVPLSGRENSSKTSRIEPLIRSRRRESALIICLESNHVRGVTAA